MPTIPDKLARYLRVTPGTETHGQSGPVWAEARNLAATRTWSLEMSLPGFLAIFGPHAGRSVDLSRTLRGCGSVVLMAATIGDDLERRSAEHFAQGRPFAGYMLDRMGSYLAESAMRELHAAARRKAESFGGAATRRFSPGYGDFSLEAQAHFMRVIGRDMPGLELTAGYILSPQKSVTAVCGVRI
ncbi:MAG: hypothetical protein ACOZEN_00070 [Thermodesulfobacteriota bacterium]